MRKSIVRRLFCAKNTGFMNRVWLFCLQFIICAIKYSMLKPAKKQKIIEKFKVHTEDTGSTEVQVALFTEKIKALSQHLKEHPKDNSSRRGLLKMVSKRRRLLQYLKQQNPKAYQKLIKKLNLKE